MGKLDRGQIGPTPTQGHGTILTLTKEARRHDHVGELEMGQDTVRIEADEIGVEGLARSAQIHLVRIEHGGGNAGALQGEPQEGGRLEFAGANQTGHQLVGTAFADGSTDREQGIGLALERGHHRNDLLAGAGVAIDLVRGPGIVIGLLQHRASEFEHAKSQRFSAFKIEWHGSGVLWVVGLGWVW